MFELNTTDFSNSLEDAFKNLVEHATVNMDKVNSDIHQDAQNKAPVDIGVLKENSGYSIKVEDNKIISYIGFQEFYAVYVHQGTGIFALEGNGRKTPWWWKGETEKWAGWHHTHGQKPKQFLWNAYLEAMPTIMKELGDGL